MGSIWAAGVLLRRLRSDVTLVVLLVALVALTGFVFAAAPRLFNRVADDALRHAVDNATYAERNLNLDMASAIEPGPAGSVGGVRDAGDELAQRFPPALAALISERTLRITAVRFLVQDTPIGVLHLSLRYQDGMDTATRLVAGRWPRDLGTPLPEAATPGTGNPPDPNARPVIFEVAFSAVAARDLGLKIGDRMAINVDGSDLLLPGIRPQIAPTEVQVVGLYEPIDPRAQYWDGDATLLQITPPNMDNPDAYAGAFIAAEAYPNLFSAGMPFRYEWGFGVDPRRVDAGQLDQIQADLRGLDFLTNTSEFGQPGVAVLRSGLLVVLDRFAADRAKVEGILGIAAIGPFVVAAGAVGTVAILLVLRRRAALIIARGRGASTWLVLGAQLWEAILLAGGAALLGLAAAQLIPARASPSSTMLALGVGAMAIVVLVAASWPSARRHLGQFAREDAPVLRVPPRRLVIELTIVGIALAGVLLLRQRGLDTDSTAADPLLLGVPVLSGLAAGIVAMRLYPWPVRGLGWLAARRRDLVPVLGLRSVGRQGAAANLILVVLLLTAAFVAFASVIVASLERGQAAASYGAVGADYRVEQTGVTSLAPMSPSSIPGVQAAAFGFIDPTTPFSSVPTQRAGLLLDAVDPVAYRAVTAATVAEPQWPGGFLAEPAGSDIGTETNPIPAILSWQLPSGSADLQPGSTFVMTINNQRLTFTLVGRSDGMPGIGEPGAFALAPYPWLKAANLTVPMRPSVLWIRGGPEVRAGLAAEAAKVAGTTRITSRHDVVQGLHNAPFSTAITAGFQIAVIVAELYLALTVIGSLVLSSARRTRDLAYLRTLGVTGAQALSLTVMEHAPAVLLAVVPGIALGIGVALLLEPSLGLSTFVGAGGVQPFVDWPALALLSAILLGVVAAAILGGTWLSRRARLVNALRVGEE